jgi:hypothetical protein
MIRETAAAAADGGVEVGEEVAPDGGVEADAPLRDEDADAGGER